MYSQTYPTLADVMPEIEPPVRECGYVRSVFQPEALQSKEAAQDPAGHDHDGNSRGGLSFPVAIPETKENNCVIG
jgi:hypothetical protein